MAIINDPRLYSGGNVSYNNLPHVQLYANLMARKQAREDALDNYMMNLNKSINSAGMRNQERAAFDEKLAEWQKFGMEHRDEIRKRKNGADIKFMQDYQDIQNIVQASKTAEERKKPAIDILTDPNKRDRLNNDKFLSAIGAQDEPLFRKDESGHWIRNEKHIPLDIAQLEFFPKAFEQDKYFKQFEDVKRMELPPTVVKNPKDMTETVTTTSVFDRDAKDLIATRAVSDYDSNPSFKHFIDSLDPKPYKGIFKEAFGHDMDGKADLAAAFTLKGIQDKVTTTKYQPDTYARQLDLQKRSQGFQAWLRKQPTYSDTHKEGQDTTTWLNEYLDDIESRAKEGKPTLLADADSQVYEIPMNPIIRKALDIGKKYTLDNVFVSQNGTYYPMYTDEDGNWVKSETRPYSKSDLIVTMGGKVVTKKKLEDEVNKGIKETPKVKLNW